MLGEYGIIVFPYPSIVKVEILTLQNSKIENQKEKKEVVSLNG